MRKCTIGFAASKAWFIYVSISTSYGVIYTAAADELPGVSKPTKEVSEGRWLGYGRPT